LGTVASGQAAREQGSGVSVEGGQYGEMAGGLARGKRKVGQAKRNSIVFYLFKKISNQFKFDSIKSDLLVLSNFQIKYGCVGN
jgi:hypothetical protein